MNVNEGEAMSRGLFDYEAAVRLNRDVLQVCD